MRMRRIAKSPYTLFMRFAHWLTSEFMRLVHWLMSDGRWFYRGSHRAAAEPVTLESLFSPEPSFLSAEPSTAPQPITIADEYVPAEPPTVEVTFSLPSEVGAADVLLCGDFNGWTSAPTPLARGNDGAWQVTLPLEPGTSYHYRYLLDGQRWENAWQADRYEPNPFGSDNSVVIVDWPELALQAA